MGISRGVLAIALLGAIGCAPERIEGPRAVDSQSASGSSEASASERQPLRQAGPSLEAPLVTAHALKARLDRGEQLVLVDVRSREAFAAEHIAGAMSRPKIDLVEGKPPLPRDRPIALYCT